MNKNGMTLPELAAELTRQAQARRDFVADTRELGFMVADTGQGALVINREPYPLTDHAHGQIAERVEIPKRYYDRMRQEAPRLLETNVRHWFDTEPEPRMIRTLDGNARAFLSTKYQRIDNDQIANAALAVILDSGAFDVVSAAVTDARLYIQARLPRLEGEVQVGDPVQAGIIISNGEIGNGAVDIQPMIYRLTCLNGMVAGSLIRDGRFRRNHVGRRVEQGEDYAVYADDTREADDRALMLKIRDSIQALSNPELFRRLLAELQASTDGPKVANPVQAVEELAKTYTLTQGERNTVLENLIRGADYSRWGLANAVTATANEHDSYDRATELQTLGGKLLTLELNQWQRITAAEAVAA